MPGMSGASLATEMQAAMADKQEIVGNPALTCKSVATGGLSPVVSNVHEREIMPYKCNICKDEPFQVPADEIGVVLMKEHLKQDHGVHVHEYQPEYVEANDNHI